MRLLTSMFIAGLLLAGPVAAEEQVAPKQANVPAAEDRGERLVCRKIAQVGSRIPQKVCRSRSEVLDERTQGKQWTRGVQDAMPSSGGLPPDVSPG
jgi:hypothetical protein